MKKFRIRNKLYISACLLGMVVCAIKMLPAEAWIDENINSNILVIALCGLLLYLSGYCLYRAVMVVNQYFTYSDLR